MPHYWYIDSTLQGARLYADLRLGDKEPLYQLILPDFIDIMQSGKGIPQMKGMWSGDKAVNATYRPAIDGLGSVDPALLLKAVLAVVNEGAAIQFSATRDFGALVMTLLNGNDRHKVYPTDAQEIAQALNDLADSFAVPATPPISKGTKR